jgi:nitroreductase
MLTYFLKTKNTPFVRPNVPKMDEPNAITNMLLKGYGACWMNEPAIAGAEIIRILEVPPDERFISLIPVGYPAYTPRTKEMKDLAKVFAVV